MKKLSTVIKSNNRLKNKINTQIKTLSGNNVKIDTNLKIEGGVGKNIIASPDTNLISGDNILVPTIDKVISSNLKQIEVDSKNQPVTNTTGSMERIDDARLVGGYRVVRTLAERDAINCCFRKTGMKVVVVGSDLSFTEYVLTSEDKCLNEWKEVVEYIDTTVDESQVILVSDYTNVQEDLVTQQDLNKFLVDFLLELENQIPKSTSDLVNDGQDGENPFITQTDIENKAEVTASNLSEDNVESWRDKLNITESVDDKNYVHDQFTPAMVWNISHPLNKKVSVTITDTAGTVMEGEIIINDGSLVTIRFNSPFSGEAILN